MDKTILIPLKTTFGCGGKAASDQVRGGKPNRNRIGRRNCLSRAPGAEPNNPLLDPIPLDPLTSLGRRSDERAIQERGGHAHEGY